MLGLTAIRAHGAERYVRREQEIAARRVGASRLAFSARHCERGSGTTYRNVRIDCGAAGDAALVGAEAGRVLLVAYWALNLPVLGQDIGTLARRFRPIAT